MPQDEVLICRSCKVAAHAKFVDGQMTSTQATLESKG